MSYLKQLAFYKYKCTATMQWQSTGVDWSGRVQWYLDEKFNFANLSYAITHFIDTSGGGPIGSFIPAWLVLPSPSLTGLKTVVTVLTEVTEDFLKLNSFAHPEFLD